jgi:hypothetical protein
VQTSTARDLDVLYGRLSLTAFNLTGKIRQVMLNNAPVPFRQEGNRLLFEKPLDILAGSRLHIDVNDKGQPHEQ